MGGEGRRVAYQARNNPQATHSPDVESAVGTEKCKEERKGIFAVFYKLLRNKHERQETGCHELMARPGRTAMVARAAFPAHLGDGRRKQRS